eukprot:GFUD01065622.1.p1 GENE.GFUD01065622.1~~GFUD01065622.1.p1  ORF type:complete len:114 (+),score=37.42 GFUD01065622.1:40-381(+)
MSYYTTSKFQHTTSSVSNFSNQSSSTVEGVAVESSWSRNQNREKVDVIDTTGLENMKEQVRGWNRKLLDIRSQLVEMRVETSSAWGCGEIINEKELRGEMEILRLEVEKSSQM